MAETYGTTYEQLATDTSTYHTQKESEIFIHVASLPDREHLVQKEASCAVQGFLTPDGIFAVDTPTLLGEV